LRVINIEGNSKNVEIKDQTSKLLDKPLNEKIDRQTKPESKTDDASNKKTEAKSSCEDKKVVSCKN